MTPLLYFCESLWEHVTPVFTSGTVHTGIFIDGTKLWNAALEHLTILPPCS